MIADKFDDAAIVAGLIGACHRIINFSIGFTEPDFAANELVWSAVAFQLIIIGEAMKHRLSQDICDQYPGVPWKGIKGMRDKLCHKQEEIDLGEVWRTALRNVPQLLVQLLEIERDLARA